MKWALIWHMCNNVRGTLIFDFLKMSTWFEIKGSSKKSWSWIFIWKKVAKFWSTESDPSSIEYMSMFNKKLQPWWSNHFLSLKKYYLINSSLRKHIKRGNKIAAFMQSTTIIFLLSLLILSCWHYNLNIIIMNRELQFHHNCINDCLKS